eukprot:212792-Rhodomonas_salina.1
MSGTNILPPTIPAYLLRHARYCWHSWNRVSPYARAMLCPVLTWCMLLPGVACRPEVGTLSCHALAMRCPVLRPRMVLAEKGRKRARGTRSTERYHS